MAVTPVRTRSPSTIVVCPTRTPSTSVMALSAPGANTPGAMPRSRARGLVWAPAPTINAETAEIAERHFHNDLFMLRACLAEARRDRVERRLEFFVIWSFLIMVVA